MIMIGFVVTKSFDIRYIYIYTRILSYIMISWPLIVVTIETLNINNLARIFPVCDF